MGRNPPCARNDSIPSLSNEVVAWMQRSEIQNSARHRKETEPAPLLSVSHSWILLRFIRAPWLFFHRLQEQIDSAIADLSAMLNAIIDCVAKMEPDQDT